MSVCIKQTITEMNCTYALSCKHGEEDTVSCCTQFDPNGSGQNLWNDLHKNGKLTESVLDAELKGRKRAFVTFSHYMLRFISLYRNI